MICEGVCGDGSGARCVVFGHWSESRLDGERRHPAGLRCDVVVRLGATPNFSRCRRPLRQIDEGMVYTVK